MIKDKILDKLAKIQAHAESAAEIGNEAEAQAFATMLQQLCLKHKIAMTDIELQEQDDTEPIEEREMDYAKGGVKLKRTRNAWQEQLMRIIARAHFCRFLVMTGTSRLILVGRDSDAAVAEYLFMTLSRTLSKMAQQASAKEYRKYYKTGMTSKMKGYKQSYINGFISRLGRRFDDERQVVESSTSTALVRVERADEEVQDFMQKYKSNARSLSQNVEFNLAGLRAGRNAANAVNLKGNGIQAGNPSQGQLSS